MPKNEVSDPITDQERAFALLVLSGAMTERQAAETVGLNPDSAAYIKSKPAVLAYMLEHRAAVEQQPIQQEAGGRHCFSLDREQVLERLWELAHLNPEMTRNSITGQVKAMSMIVAILGLIPDRRSAVAQEKSPTDPVKTDIYESAWLRELKAKAAESQPSATPPQQEDSTSVPDTDHAPGSAAEASPGPGPSQSTSANTVTPAEAEPPAPAAPSFSWVPDSRVPFAQRFDRFNRRR